MHIKRITHKEVNGDDRFYLDGKLMETEGEAIDDLIEEKKNSFANALLKL